MLRSSLPILSVILLFATMSFQAQAQIDLPEKSTDEVSVMSAKEAGVDSEKLNNQPTHPTLHLTPDKSEIIRLDKKVGSVIVGNPAHANILVDTTTTLVIVPRQPGASYFTVMDQNGNVIMQRHIVVAGGKEQYVRIRRQCQGGSACQPTSVYYCPDSCHEIAISDGEGSSASGGSEEISGNASQQDNGEDDNNQDDTLIPDEQ